MPWQNVSWLTRPSYDFRASVALGAVDARKAIRCYCRAIVLLRGDLFAVAQMRDNAAEAWSWGRAIMSRLFREIQPHS